MQQKKTKIILDADVIIHFVKAEAFSLLPDIFPEYEYVILDVVYNEVSKDHRTKALIDNYTSYFSKITQERFSPTGASLKDYFQYSGGVVLDSEAFSRRFCGCRLYS